MTTSVETRLRVGSAVVTRAAMATAATHHTDPVARGSGAGVTVAAWQIDASDAMAWPCEHDRATTDDDLLRFFTV